MSTVDTTVEEMAGSLNGFEELAIKKHFDANLMALKEDGVMALRALVFCDMRRKGSTDRDAYKAAMEMRLRDAEDYFADDEPETDPDTPETDQGKDD